jgi:hypothetical protein
MQSEGTETEESRVTSDRIDVSTREGAKNRKERRIPVWCVHVCRSTGKLLSRKEYVGALREDVFVAYMDI